MMRSQTHPAQPDTGELNITIILLMYYLRLLMNQGQS